MMATLSTPIMDIVHLVLEVKTELLLFVLAALLHRILFVNRASANQEKAPKMKGSAFAKEETEETVKEAGPQGRSADPARALGLIEAAYERGDHRVVLRWWNSLRRTSTVPAFHLALIVESMQRMKTDRTYIVAQVERHLNDVATSCDVVYINYLLKSVAKSLDAELVAGLLGLMPKLGLQPDSGIYETLIQMHFATRSFEDVAGLAAEMRARNVQPTGRTSLVLLKSALYWEDFEEVLRRFREVARATDNLPTASMMPQHVMSQIVDLAFKVGQGEALSAQFSDDNVLHQALRQAIGGRLLDRGDARKRRSESLGVQDLRVEKGHVPVDDIATAVLEACSRTGDENLASRIKAQAQDFSENASGKTGVSKQTHMVDELAYLRSVSTDSKAMIALIRSMSAQGNLNGALKMFQALNASGAEMSNSAWNAMLDACVEHNELEQAEALMHKMQAAGIEDAVSFNTLLKAFLRREEYERVSAFMDQMRKAGFAPNGVTYNELIHALARSPNPQRRNQIGKVVDEMRREGIEPNRITYSILLKNLGPKTPFSEVTSLMRLMDTMREPMDEVLSCSIIEACVRVGRHALVSQKLRQLHMEGNMPTTTSHTFGSLIKAYGYTKDIAGAWKCWRDMRSQHVKPTSITIGCMVEAVATNGDVDGGHELIQGLLNDDSTQSQVNSIIYGSVLKGYGRAGNMDRMWEVFSEMMCLGIKPSQSTFNALIDACARNSTMSKVPGLMDGMREHGFEPNLITYSSVIKGFCQQGDVQAALQTLEELRKRPRVKADEIVYNTLIDGCSQDGLVETGEKLLHEMEAEGICPSNYTLSSLVKLMGAAKRPDRALRIVETISKKYRLQPDVYVSNSLVKALLQSRELKQAIKVLEQMVRDKLQPEARTCQTILFQLLNVGNLVQAASILRALINMPPSSRSSEGRHGVAAALLCDTAFINKFIVAMQHCGFEGQELSKALQKDLRGKRPNFEIDSRDS